MQLGLFLLEIQKTNTYFFLFCIIYWFVIYQLYAIDSCIQWWSWVEISLRPTFYSYFKESFSDEYHIYYIYQYIYISQSHVGLEPTTLRFPFRSLPTELANLTQAWHIYISYEKIFITPFVVNFSFMVILTMEITTKGTTATKNSFNKSNHYYLFH